jgi:hypothetical protein
LGIGTSSPAYQLDTGTLGHNSTGELLLTGGNSASNDYTQTTLLRLRATSINPNRATHNDAASVAEIRLNHADLAGNNSSGSISFYTNPSNYNTTAQEAMRIDSSGRVGIGTSSPSARLEVGDGVSSEAIKVNAGAGWADVRLHSNATNGGSIYFNDGADAGQLFYYHVDDSMRFHTATTERMRIDSSGNVGIGATSANSSRLRLDNGGTSGAPQLMLTATGASTQTEIRHDTSNNLIFDNWNSGRNERMRIDSSGNVGIGTSSPSKRLEILDSTTSPSSYIQGIRLTGNGGNYYDIGRVAGTGELTVSGNQSGVPLMTWVQNGTERMRIDASGNVGINQSSPSSYYAKNLVVGAATEGGITIASNATTAWAYLMFADGTSGDDAYSGYLGHNHATDNLVLSTKGDLTFQSGGSTRLSIDSGSGNITNSTNTTQNGFINFTNTQDGGNCGYIGNANALVAGTHSGSLGIRSQGHLVLSSGGNTERMRIDSSGNVLMGQTSGSSSDAGHIFNPIGVAFHIRDGGVPLVAVRKTNDGELIQFKKDTAVVGSIGTETSNSDLYIGNGDTAIMFHDGADAIFPHNASTNAGRDAAIDIGYSTYRFKDAYLSGGVYLGGTGAANKLSDFETGSWTPALGGTWSTNPTSLVGSYTKIGNVVHITFNFSGGVKGSIVGGYFTGLPFTTSLFGTGSVSDSGVNDKGNCLFFNTNRVWVTANSFSGVTYITGTYTTTS